MFSFCMYMLFLTAIFALLHDSIAAFQLNGLFKTERFNFRRESFSVMGLTKNEEGCANMCLNQVDCAAFSVTETGECSMVPVTVLCPRYRLDGGGLYMSECRKHNRSSALAPQGNISKSYLNQNVIPSPPINPESVSWNMIIDGEQWLDFRVIGEGSLFPGVGETVDISNVTDRCCLGLDASCNKTPWPCIKKAAKCMAGHCPCTSMTSGTRSKNCVCTQAIPGSLHCETISP